MPNNVTPPRADSRALGIDIFDLEDWGGGATPRRATTRRELIQKVGGKCVYKDPMTGRVCGSRYQLEIDHITPKAKGGTEDPANFRCYCRRHNQWAAEVEFGSEFMDRRRSN